MNRIIIRVWFIHVILCQSSILIGLFDRWVFNIKLRVWNGLDHLRIMRIFQIIFDHLLMRIFTLFLRFLKFIIDTLSRSIHSVIKTMWSLLSLWFLSTLFLFFNILIPRLCYRLTFLVISIRNLIPQLILFLSSIYECSNDLNHIKNLFRIASCYFLPIYFLSDIFSKLIKFIDEY